MAYDGPVEDRLAIRELLETYSDAVVRRDEAAWAATWAEDGVWSFRGREIRGRENILATWRPAMAAYSSVGFFAVPGEIIVQGDHAHGRTHTLEFLVPPEGPRRAQVGLYEDRFVRRNGTWLFAARSFTVVQSG